MRNFLNFFGHACLILVATGGLIGLSGCGDSRPGRVKVSGQVLIDGQPLKFGHVRFVPKGARSSEGKLDETGHFTLTCYDGDDGAVPGMHRIEVSSAEPINANQMRWHAPEKYANVSTSELEQEITGPTDSVVVKLTWSGGKPFVEGSASGSDSKNKTPTRGQD